LFDEIEKPGHLAATRTHGGTFRFVLENELPIESGTF